MFQVKFARARNFTRVSGSTASREKHLNRIRGARAHTHDKAVPICIRTPLHAKVNATE